VGQAMVVELSVLRSCLVCRRATLLLSRKK
jgi:hypothetical protein